MRERIVVCFRTELASTRDDELASYLERARRIREHATALGGSLCAWSVGAFAIELLPDSLEEAIVLVGQATDEVTSAPGAQPFGIGISQGVLFSLGEANSFANLGWGAPLVAATALAAIARPGEVLLDEAMPAVEHGEIPTCGMNAGVYGELRVRGLLLDPLYVPSLSSPSLEATAAPTEAPPSRISLAPSQSSGPERRYAIEALSKGDLNEALTALRKGVEKTRTAPPVERARALLAHGIALAANGRDHEALFEVLEALARAREAGDARGEEACARFLAKLAEGAGQSEVALRWKQVVARG